MTHWKGRKVLVTGCTGLMGSWLAKKLVAEGANVTGLIRDSAPQSELILSGTIKKITVVDGDVSDYNTVLRTINEYEIQTVFHLAAQTIVGTASRSPLSTFETNIKGTWTVLEAARASELDCDVVVASSDKAYGEQQKLPYTEEMPLLGSYPYDVSKASADMLARSYFKSYGMNVAVTRCANLFGGGDLNFSRLIPGTILWALKKQPVIIRSDGKYKRDYLYVEDAADCYMTLAENIRRQGVKGQAFNFGNGQPISVVELVNKILAITKSKVPVKIENSAKNEIRDQYLSTEKARKVLKWKPSHSLDSSLKKTFEWYERQYKAGLF
ncbi:MAG: NAD-dependent epimerase/dehydratase family protein [Nanoarchaeota archaeon]|nr:MAG: NAD-dependent epimerase/dehydratase family protein [Nanoarchaeota archaeon]